MKKIFLVTAFLLIASLMFAGQVRICDKVAGGDCQVMDSDGNAQVKACSGTDCQGVNDEGAATVISQSHDQIEKKYAYNGRHYIADIDTPQGNTLTVYVPAGTEVHLRFTQLLAETNDTDWTLYVNATSMVGDSGTTVTAIGNADSSGDTPASKWYIGGTMVGGTNKGYGGRLIADEKYFIGTDGINEEIVLHAGLHYVYIEPIADNTPFHIRWHFYEPE